MAGDQREKPNERKFSFVPLVKPHERDNFGDD
jgi:hypothetical protein